MFGLGGGDLGTAGAVVTDGGGGFDDRKTMFGVDAEGVGIGDPAEVVSIISCMRRHDRVSAWHGGHGMSTSCMPIALSLNMSFEALNEQLLACFCEGGGGYPDRRARA